MTGNVSKIPESFLHYSVSNQIEAKRKEIDFSTSYTILLEEKGSLDGIKGSFFYSMSSRTSRAIMFL